MIKIFVLHYEDNPIESTLKKEEETFLPIRIIL